MDLTLREWLLILGSILILVLVVHGYMRSRKNTNPLILDESLIKDRAQTTQGTEPSGGGHASRRVQAAFDEPMHDEALHDEALHDEALHDEALQDEALHDEALHDEARHDESLHDEALHDEALHEKPLHEAPAQQAVYSEVPANEMPAKEISANQSPSDKTPDDLSASAASEARPQARIPEKIVQVHVLALDEPFTGPRLLEVLTDSGLVFGEMDIFHKLDAQERVEFSLASALEPGSFELSSIEDFAGPGIILFLRVHELPEPLRVFDDLLTVAQAIALELHGELRDETHSVMTPQTIDHYRQVIKDFQFKYLA